MRFSLRLEIILNELNMFDSLIDVGCDHGKIAFECFNRNYIKNQIIVTDISLDSLNKSIKLLKEYIEKGRCIAKLNDGFAFLEKKEAVLIAGMGGMEIISILKNKNNLFVPENLVLQPMKNTEKVRRFLIENNFFIVKDYKFFADNKFYDLIVAKLGKDSYSELEYVFGRDNLKTRSLDFIKFLEKELFIYENLLKKIKTAKQFEKIEYSRLLREIYENK